MDQDVMRFADQYLENPVFVTPDVINRATAADGKTHADHSSVIYQKDGSRNLSSRYYVVLMQQSENNLVFRTDDPCGGEHMEQALSYDPRKKSSETSSPLHSHHFVEFGFVLDGTLDIVFPDRKTIHFHCGDIVLMSHSVQHAEVYGKDTATMLYLQLSDEFFNACMNFPDPPSDAAVLRDLALEKKESFQYVRFSPRDTASKSHHVLRQILQELLRREPGYSEVISGLIIRLLYAILTEYDSVLTKEEEKNFRFTLFQSVCKYINLHTTDITVHQLTDVFHYNSDFYSRLIKEYTGQSYVQYLQSVRLEQAEKLLIETQLPVTEIAARVGYSNMRFFYRIFSARNGQLPNAFRKQFQRPTGSRPKADLFPGVHAGP